MKMSKPQGLQTTLNFLRVATPSAPSKNLLAKPTAINHVDKPPPNPPSASAHANDGQYSNNSPAAPSTVPPATKVTGATVDNAQCITISDDSDDDIFNDPKLLRSIDSAAENMNRECTNIVNAAESMNKKAQTLPLRERINTNTVDTPVEILTPPASSSPVVPSLPSKKRLLPQSFMPSSIKDGTAKDTQGPPKRQQKRQFPEPIVLSDEQKQVLEIVVKQRQSLFFTGAAGEDFDN